MFIQYFWKYFRKLVSLCYEVVDTINTRFTIIFRSSESLKNKSHESKCNNFNRDLYLSARDPDCSACTCKAFRTNSRLHLSGEIIRFHYGSALRLSSMSFLKTAICLVTACEIQISKKIRRIHILPKLYMDVSACFCTSRPTATVTNCFFIAAL
jgi:hypothetical protein